MRLGGLLAGLLVLAASDGCGSKTTPHPDGGDGQLDARDASPDGDGGTCPTTGILKPTGQPCTCASECTSGFCADGVCCNSACTEGCRTCGTTGSLGICTNVPMGAAPGAGARKTTCATTPVAGCGLDGKCDGAGDCRNFPMGTVCQVGSCDGDALSGGLACDGAGKCRPGATVICVPYTCDATAHQCFGSCGSSTQCVSGQACSTESCGQKPIGATCHGNTDCGSGFCTDGVCCNVACQGPCVACNQLLRQGTCWPTDTGLPDPHGVCVDEGKQSCGHTGTCDGIGGCARYAQDMQCQAPSCSGNKLNTAGTCDGLGTCRPPGVSNCHPFACVNGACNSHCQADTDCDLGIACVNNTCGPKVNGQPCLVATECASNQCVDGVCCESACTGQCRSCSLASSPGRCTVIAAGNADPRGVCKDGKASACGQNGKCDGGGGCQKYPVGTQCADETCASNVYTPPATCSASGQCVAPDALPCQPYVCNGSKCFNVCSSTAQCFAPNSCVMNSCGLKDDGASCNTATECKSNVCAQGYCCHTACTGPCRSCAISLGVCTNVATGAGDPAGICTDQGAASCGTNGKCEGGACQKYTAGTSCHDATCPVGTTMDTARSTCDGAGVCVKPGTISCFPFLCGTGACRNTCASNGDCAAPASCINGSCGLKPMGLACSDKSECQSGFCADGYCCASACTGKCQSCGLTGSLGTCANVANGKTDPKQTCVDAGAASCGTDGFCDGNGGCRLYAASTSCAPPTCPTGSSTATSLRTCNGKGVCQAATSLPCAPYVCNGSTGCKAACTVDGDCLLPSICDPKTNLCGNKRRLGQSCTATADCLTGASCVDGVCCSASVCGTCQACNVAGSAGSCTNLGTGVAEPHGLCAASPPCGNTGACNGAGACQQAGTGVSCGAVSCTGSTYTPTSHCNGSGACAAPTPASCGNYVCGASACKTTCAVDGDCVAPNTCQGGNCARKPSGLACASASQCISGFCTNGVCCGNSTCPTCQACNINGLGSCAPLAAGTTAPGTQCPASPPCGNTGACNGSGACTQAAATVACGAASCTGSTFTPVSHCSGAGACATPVTSSCAPNICGINACKAACTTDIDCTSGNYCGAGTCQAKKAGGASCTAGNECGNGLCTNGHCCGVATCPTCQVCGTAGTCANVGSGTTDTRCAAAAPCGNTGACDGAGACTQAATTVACGSASCTGSTFTPISHCTGGGACATPTTSSCGAYVCGTTACKTACAADVDCTSGNYCAAGVCQAKKSSGATCSAGNECGNGLCTDGHCCGVPTCPSCQSCGASGTCANLGLGVADPHGGCPASAPCGNTGVCNGAGACQQTSASSLCAGATCAATAFTPAAFCSGTGNPCPTPATQNCGAYLCTASGCKTTCALDTDCASGNYCTGTNGTCQAKKAPGAVCSAAHECGGGAANCTDGVCCVSAACGTCQACNLSVNGTCATVATGNPEPHGLCPAAPPCGNTGLCSAGVCQLAGTSVSCGAAGCAGATFQPAALCNGSGGCSVPAPTNCAPHLCTSSGCQTTCTVDGDCVAGTYCSGGSCLAKQTNGATCSGANQCTSGQCTEGYCCSSGACPSCQSCAVAGLQGTCTNVLPGGSDPTGSCVAQSAASCKQDGACDGSGSCRLYGAATVCSTSCSSDNATLTSTFCDGAGTCGPGAMTNMCVTNTCVAGPPSTCQ